MRPSFIKTDEFLSADMRLTHAAKPYFARMAKKPIGLLEERYPITDQLLFEAALKCTTGKHEFPLPETIDSSTMVHLLQKIAVSSKKTPEIFETNLTSTISEFDLEGLCQLFNEYIANLLLPSYLSVKTLLNKGKIVLAEEMALNLTHAQDQTKSLEMLIQYYLSSKDIQKAISLFSYIPITSDRRDIVSKIIAFLLKNKQLDLAINFCNKLNDNGLECHAFHEISLGLAKENMPKESLDILNKIEDPDLKAYTLSLIIGILTNQAKFVDASKLVFDIQDTDYRQDGLNDIVKKMIRVGRMHDAGKFIDRLEGTKEKLEANKIMESSLKVHLLDKKIRDMRRFY